MIDRYRHVWGLISCSPASRQVAGGAVAAMKSSAWILSSAGLPLEIEIPDPKKRTGTINGYRILMGIYPQ